MLNQWAIFFQGRPVRNLVLLAFHLKFSLPLLPANDVDRFEQARHDDQCRSQKLPQVALTLANVLEEGELRDEQLDDRTGGEDGELSR